MQSIKILISNLPATYPLAWFGTSNILKKSG
jgi:hypothetical protein